MKNRKIPQRKCIVTNEMKPKKEMIRIVKTKENEVFVDLSGKKNGRGAYMTIDLEVVEQAKKQRVLDRVFGLKVNESIYEELSDIAQTK